MMPMPPSWAIAMANRASVTVSIAAEMSGICKAMRRESAVLSSVSRGKTLEYAGTSKTSSKVSARLISLMACLGTKRHYKGARFQAPALPQSWDQVHRWL